VPDGRNVDSASDPPHPRTADAESDERRRSRERILELYDELLAHDGFGSLEVRMRWLKRGLKEVLVSCGKEYRYVIRVG